MRRAIIFLAPFASPWNQIMKVKALKSILTAVTISGFVGCAAPGPVKTYGGQQLPVRDVSILMVDRQTFVRNIAGYETGITFTAQNMPMEGTQFEVKPGLQKIVLDFYFFSSSSDNVGAPPKGTIVTTTNKSVFTLTPIRISHDFEKGHKYELYYRRDGKKISAQIVDVTNGGTKRDYSVTWGQL